jgi:hypothetical protein
VGAAVVALHDLTVRAAERLGSLEGDLDATLVRINVEHLELEGPGRWWGRQTPPYGVHDRSDTGSW